MGRTDGDKTCGSLYGVYTSRYIRQGGVHEANGEETPSMLCIYLQYITHLQAKMTDGSSPRLKKRRRALQVKNCSWEFVRRSFLKVIQWENRCETVPSRAKKMLTSTTHVCPAGTQIHAWLQQAVLSLYNSDGSNIIPTPGIPVATPTQLTPYTTASHGTAHRETSDNDQINDNRA